MSRVPALIHCLAVLDDFDCKSWQQPVDARCVIEFWEKRLGFDFELTCLCQGDRWSALRIGRQPHHTAVRAEH